jgi:hypothetical protein
MNEEDTQSEVEWVRTNVVPLLHRLGFIRVDFTHGPTERGKDIVFAELDRFGLLRYYAAQAKREALHAKEGGREFEALCAQLRSAYEYEYADPTSGRRVKMSGVYLLTMGSVTPEVRSRLVEKTGQWLHFVDSDQLEIAKNVSGWPHPRERQALLFALRIDLRMRCHKHLETLEKARETLQTTNISLPASRYTLHNLYRAEPFILEELMRKGRLDDYGAIEVFRDLAENTNSIMDSLGTGASQETRPTFDHLHRMIGEMSDALSRAIEVVEALEFGDSAEQEADDSVEAPGVVQAARLPRM